MSTGTAAILISVYVLLLFPDQHPLIICSTEYPALDHIVPIFINTVPEFLICLKDYILSFHHLVLYVDDLDLPSSFCQLLFVQDLNAAELPALWLGFGPDYGLDQIVPQDILPDVLHLFCARVQKRIVSHDDGHLPAIRHL